MNNTGHLYVNRSVQAQQFGQHFLEVVIIVDMRQVTGICCFVSFPVDAMDRRIVEFVFHLTPYMIENIFAFHAAGDKKTQP